MVVYLCECFFFREEDKSLMYLIEINRICVLVSNGLLYDKAIYSSHRKKALVETRTSKQHSNQQKPHFDRVYFIIKILYLQIKKIADYWV